MLKHLSNIWDYRDFLHLHFSRLDASQRILLSTKYKSVSFKLKKLDPGLAKDILFPLYSSFGRPAIDPAILIRSFVLMSALHYTSIHAWCDDLRNDSLLQYLIGSFDPPNFSSHYDFIIRLTGYDPHFNADSLLPKDFISKKLFKSSPPKGEKLINFSDDDTFSLSDKYKNGTDFDRDRLMFTLQSLFNAIAVIPSLDNGFIDLNNGTLSADGSSLHIHASPHGKKVIDDPNCVNAYRFSAPDADYGWDSDENRHYFGFTFYNISYHNRSKHLDLPVFIALEKASRHDALTCISASAQMLDINPDLKPTYMCLDSASDSNPIYAFFQEKGIIPIIDHNKRRSSCKKEQLDENGVPICMGNHPMVYDGYDYTRYRKKFRCPFVRGKIDSCPFKDQCCPSDYGKIAYVKDDKSAPRFAGPIVYKSHKWKEIYKNRTCTERINNYVLNTYGLHKIRCRNGAKNAFFAIFAGINIHLDAWIKNDLA